MVSKRRTASLISYFVLQCLIAVVMYVMLTVPRTPLPSEEIGALVEAVGNNVEIPWPKPQISVSAVVDTLSQADLQDFVQRLTVALAFKGVDADVVSSSPASTDGLGACTTDGSASSDGTAQSAACVTAMEELAMKTPDDGGNLTAASFTILLVPTKACSALILDAGTSAILRYHSSGKGLGSQMVASRLLETWFKKLPLLSASALFEIAPSYLFSFFLVSDCNRRVAWDFQKGVHMPYLRRFLARLHSLIDFEVDSQVVQCSSLQGSVSDAGSAKEEVGVEALKADFLRNAGEWPGDTVTTDARWLPPLIRLAAFWPSTPLKVLDSEHQSQQAFAVPGWGAVAIVGAGGDNASCSEEACTPPSSQSEGKEGEQWTQHALSSCAAQGVASSWVGILRSWFTLRPEAPSPANSIEPCSDLLLFVARPQLDGIARWEQLLVANVVHTIFVRRSAETLQNFMALVDSLPDLEISAEIGAVVSEAVTAAQQAISEAKVGNLNEALSAARLALRLSLTASHDDTVVAQMYFSWQFKWAVYLPLLLPILVPTISSLVREFKRARAAPPPKAEPVTEEVQ